MAKVKAGFSTLSLATPAFGREVQSNSILARVGGSDPIEAAGVADRLHMTRQDLATTLGLGRDALDRQDRATSRKSQQRLRELLEIIALVRDWAGSEFAAMSWYRATPIPAFGGRTAEAVVKDGNAHVVRDYLDHLALGGYA